MLANDMNLAKAILNTTEKLLLIEADTIEEAAFAEEKLQELFDEMDRNVRVLALPASVRVIGEVSVVDADD